MINISLGLVSNQRKNLWINNAEKDELRRSQGQITLEVFSENFLKQFRKKIWIPRCEKVIAWERRQNIDNKKKKRRVDKNYKEISKKNTSDKRRKRSRKTTQSRTDQRPQDSRKKTKRIDRKEVFPKLKDKVKEVV